MANGIGAYRACVTGHCAVIVTSVLAACSRQADDEQVAEARKPQQAGQEMNPAETAAHIVGARVAAVIGNQQAAEGHVLAITDDMRRSARLSDPMRRINRETAQAAVRLLPGVKSVIWLDDDNLIVLVAGQRHRNMAKIDEVCLALEPLGDTLAVVVNLQDATATNGDDAMTLSRPCQLAKGQMAAFQKKRQVDVVDRETREAFKGMQRK